MDYAIATTVRFIPMCFLLWWSIPSYGGEKSTTLPADECAHAFAKFELTKALTVSLDENTWHIDSVKIRDGYSVERFVSTLPPKKKANRITALLQKKKDGQPGDYEVAAVCLEDKKDMDSQGGLINFYSEKGVKAPIFFVLNDGEEVTWPALPKEAIYLKEFPEGGPLPTPGPTDWLACRSKRVYKTAKGEFGGVVWFRTCKDVTSAHLYEYVLRLYQVVNGVACYSDKCLRTIDPQIIHQPR